MDSRAAGRHIRVLREMAGETKRELARVLGISYSSMCQYEYGLRMPGDDVKMRIAKHFNVSVESIFFTE